MTTKEFNEVQKYSNIRKGRKLRVSDYTKSDIEKQVEIFFRDLKNFVLEDIETMPPTDKDVENGIQKFCKQKVLDIFQMDEDLNY